MPSKDPTLFVSLHLSTTGRENKQGGMGLGASQPGLHYPYPPSAVETLLCQVQSHCYSMTLGTTPRYT